MTAELEGGEWSAARPGRTLPPGKTRYPFYRKLCGPQGRSGRAENLVPTGIRSRTVHPVVSRYTDWTTKVLVGLQNINNTNKLPRDSYVVSHHTYLTFYGIFFYDSSALVGLGPLIFAASWSHPGVDYTGIFYKLVASGFTSFKLAGD